MKDRLLQIGVAVSALCCFTPVLVWVLAGLGLVSAIGYLDLVLLPAMAGFTALTGYALWKRSRN